MYTHNLLLALYVFVVAFVVDSVAKICIVQFVNANNYNIQHKRQITNTNMNMPDIM